MVYRRGPEQMGATGHEQAFAQTNGVRIKHWLRPVRLEGEGGVRAAVFQGVELAADGALVDTGGEQAMPCDMVFKAVGQSFVPLAADGPDLTAGRIAVDESGRTSLSDVWAGGDCVAGEDLTVQAVQDGKVAAGAIADYLKNMGS